MKKATKGGQMDSNVGMQNTLKNNNLTLGTKLADNSICITSLHQD